MNIDGFANNNKQQQKNNDNQHKVKVKLKLAGGASLSHCCKKRYGKKFCSRGKFIVNM